MWSKAITASLVVLLSTGLAHASLYEIGFSSIYTTYDHITGQLKFEQEHTVMVVEDPGQQQHYLDGVYFLLTASLQEDHSSEQQAGQAAATFAPGSLTILDESDPASPLLEATVSLLKVEESVALTASVLTFTGDLAVTAWGFWWPQPADGELFALSWQLGNAIDDFDDDDLTTESSVAITLVAEPATVVLVLAGAAALLAYRRRQPA